MRSRLIRRCDTKRLQLVFRVVTLSHIRFFIIFVVYEQIGMFFWFPIVIVGSSYLRFDVIIIF